MTQEPLEQGAEAGAQGYRALWTEKQYLKDLIATAVSRFGDSIDAIALSYLVYQLTGSAALTAVTFGVNTGVSVVLQPVAAALVTGREEKPIVVGTALGRGAIVCLMAALFALGLAQPWMLIAAAALISTLEAFGQPAGTQLYPRIVPREKYTVAMSLSGALNRGCEIVGMALAGVLIATLGVHGALLIDAGAFLASGLVLATLRVPAREKPERQGGAVAQFWSDFKGGLGYMRANPLALAICLSACALNLCFVPFSTLQVPFVEQGLGLGATAISVIGVSMTLGMALGSVAYPKLAARFARFSILFSGVMLLSVAFVLMPLVSFVPGDPAKWVALVLVMLAIGASNAFANTSVQVSFMENVEEGYLARVSGIMGSLCMAAMPVGSFVVAAVASRVSIIPLLIGCGVFSVLISLGFLLVKPLRKL